MSEDFLYLFLALVWILVLTFVSFDFVDNDYDSISIIIETASGEKTYINPDWYRVISGGAVVFEMSGEKITASDYRIIRQIKSGD